MAGKGPSGATLPDLAMPTVLPTSHEKCPKSPGKRKYYNLIDAESAAAFSAQQYGKPMRAYVCDGCGLYHVTGKIHYGDITESRADGTIVSAGMSTRPAWKEQTLAPSVERVDMSEIIAAESPIIPANPAATEKLVANMVEGRESVTVPELIDALQISRFQASQALRNLGWQGTRGRPEWLPPGVERPSVKRAQPGKTVRGTANATALTRTRKKKLAAFLADKDAISLVEAQVHISAGKDVSKALLHQLGWEPARGAGSRGKWTPTSGQPAARRRIVPTPEELQTETEVTVNDPIDMQTRRPAEAAPAREPVPASAIAVPISELGWRDIPNPDGVRTKTIEQMMDELSPYGIEVRIQIRERR